MRMSFPAAALAASALLSACATTQIAATAPSHEPHLERVVMLMRHGVRPPTKAAVTPPGVAAQAWPAWSVEWGELTPHGYDAVRLLAQWDRRHWVDQGLLPAEGCPAAGQVHLAASSKSRTQATARALAEGLAPGCPLEVEFPASPADDAEFHPLDAGAVAIDPDLALAAQMALAPAGGLEAEMTHQAPMLKRLSAVLGCCTVEVCAEQALPAGCDLSQWPQTLTRNDEDRADLAPPLGLASTVSQTFLLEYLEGKPMDQVGWGRVSRDDIEAFLSFHTLKFYYEGRAPYVAARAASPLARRMLDALENGPALTVLAGHDTNIADLGGMLDLHWKVPGYPADNPPPGGAVGFELWRDAAGQGAVRAFYRAQTMDQVRDLRPLTGDEQAAFQYILIPGCDAPCRLEDFDRLVRSRLIASRP
ncbi:MAG: histidine-type phosphatase [Candidatus Brevundimonas phytovorans]|nr:histidine-type phosphatase [Brevundimonas sp.]WEK58601.1 MAG: histidine-type phosphatase [Brevundimonas sp.]